MSDPETIYLQPNCPCTAHGWSDRMWCESDMQEEWCRCDPIEPGVRYVRADIAEAENADLLAQRDSLNAEVKRLRALVEAAYKEGWANGVNRPTVPSEWEKSFVYKELARVRGEEKTCDHDWVDARNEAITSGQWCRKCNAVRGESSDE